MPTGLIDAEKANYSIVRMTRLLAVSRSGYYKWRSARTAGPSQAQRRRGQLDAKVKELHAGSDGVYGAPRILADLRGDGETSNPRPRDKRVPDNKDYTTHTLSAGYVLRPAAVVEQTRPGDRQRFGTTTG